MKASNILKIALLAMPLIVCSCGSKKKVVVEDPSQTVVVTDENKFIQKVTSNAQSNKFVTSKI